MVYMYKIVVHKLIIPLQFLAPCFTSSFCPFLVLSDPILSLLRTKINTNVQAKYGVLMSDGTHQCQRRKAIYGE